MKAKKIYESLEDVFKPKSLEDVEKSLAENPSSNQNLIFRVFSGVDAFVFPNEIVPNKEKIYLPYIDVIAKTKEQAREKVARMFGQKLEDQKENINYDNYISEHVEIIGRF
jgi:hypothetical protein